jgi:ribosomal protein L11 methylase PrmA
MFGTTRNSTFPDYTARKRQQNQNCGNKIGTGVSICQATCVISTTEQTNNGHRQPQRSECKAAAQNSAAVAAAVTAVVDLCSGLGGLSFAAKNLGMRVVAGVDVNSSALKTFGKNFPDANERVSPRIMTFLP